MATSFFLQPLKISISSSCNILGQESKFVVKTCETTGEYIFAPTQMKGTAVTTVKYVIHCLCHRFIPLGTKCFEDYLH